MSTAEKQFDQCRAAIAKRMQVCAVAAGFQVIESPTADGAFLKVWPPTFQTRRAAELFMEELTTFYAICDPAEIYGAGLEPELYEEVARVWGSLERQGVANPRELAKSFCARWPAWWPGPLH